MEKENLNFYKIIIASYLHDIWKLLWRWWFNRLEQRDFKVAHAQHLRDILLFWEDYYKQNKPTWIKDFLDLKDNEFWKDIAYIWSLHHSGDKLEYNKFFDYINDTDEKEFRKKLVSIVYLGDNIASLDRFQEENDKAEKEEKENDKTIKQTGLWSIFENIFNLENNLNNNKYFSNKDKLENINIPIYENKDDFNILAKDFYDELIVLIKWNINIETKEEKEFKKFIYDFDLLFQRYFSLVPSDAFQWITQDLSLYDHSKIVVAISSILYKKFIFWEKTNLSFSTKDIQEKEITLLAWDFPSIQKYIFDSIKKQSGISKRLRAKSFMIQILNEAVIEYILVKTWYSRANVLINAWWKFVIITDLLSKQGLEDLKENINNFLLKKYNGNIKFSLVWKNKKIWEVFANNNWKLYDLNTIKHTFENLFEELSKDKFQVYNKNNLNSLFKNESISWKILCKYCWQNYLDKKENEYDENSEENICEICKNEKYIWEKLVKNDAVFIDYIDKNWNFDFNPNFDKWSFKILFNNWDYKKLKNQIWIWKSINLYVPKTTKENLEKTTRTFENIIRVDKLLKEIIWENEENIKTWEWLDYICMLKWDIDSMSLIFKHWFDYWDIKSDKRIPFYSVNRLTQFSRFLELFFGKYLNDKIKEKFENVYTVFSGWDDFVFIVPFWVRQEFTNFLYEEFNSFVAWNYKIHFSIWIWIFKAKTPFKTMNDKTEELLIQAKKL
jgi:CRISPR-associated protein Csm1